MFPENLGKVKVRSVVFQKKHYGITTVFGVPALLVFIINNKSIISSTIN